MSGDIFFVRNELPDDPINKGHQWSLVVVKIDDTQLGPYFGFSTREAAQLFADRSPGLSVVAASELDNGHYFDFTTRKVVLFESRALVEQYLADRAHFPYTQHLHQYSLKDGLARVVV